MLKSDTIVLIPSYEPNKLLVDTAKGVFDAGFEVLVVNDGSNNSFDPIFKEAEKFATVIGYEKNKGKGGALKYGYKYIRDNYKDAKYVITADGDGQHALEDIKHMSELLHEKDEFVLGVRYLDKSVPFRSRFGNEWSKATRTLVTKQYLVDDQCGLRGYPTRYLNDLIKVRGSRYHYEMNQIVVFQLKQYEVIQLPINVIYSEEDYTTHFSAFIDTVKIQSSIILNGVGGLISLAALAVGLTYLNIYHFDYYHLLTVPAFLASGILLFLLNLCFFPSKKAIKDIFKELLFSFVKSIFAFGLLFIFMDVCHLYPEQIIPPMVILLSLLNLPLSRLSIKKPHIIR